MQTSRKWVCWRPEAISAVRSLSEKRTFFKKRFDFVLEFPISIGSLTVNSPLKENLFFSTTTVCSVYKLQFLRLPYSSLYRIHKKGDSLFQMSSKSGKYPHFWYNGIFFSSYSFFAAGTQVRWHRDAITYIFIILAPTHIISSRTQRLLHGRHHHHDGDEPLSCLFVHRSVFFNFQFSFSPFG